MIRRLVLMVVVALAVPTIALADHTEPKKQINAADQRRAASIVLKRSDFGAGWSKSPKKADVNEHFNCPGYNPNESDLVLTGEAEADYDSADGDPSISSYANVYKTRREATASWARSAKPALAPCLATLLKREIEQNGGKVVIAKHGTFPFPRYAPRGVAYRVVMKVTVSSSGTTTTVPFTLHVIALGNGRGDSVLMAVGLRDGVPDAALRKYAKLTASRFAAAKL